MGILKRTHFSDVRSCEDKEVRTRRIGRVVSRRGIRPSSRGGIDVRDDE